MISPFSTIEGQSQTSIEKDPINPSVPKKVPFSPFTVSPPVFRLSPADFPFIV